MSHRYAAGHFAEVGLVHRRGGPSSSATTISRTASRSTRKSRRTWATKRAFPRSSSAAAMLLGIGAASAFPPRAGPRRSFANCSSPARRRKKPASCTRVRDGQSILDDVGDQISDLNRKVGNADRQRLDLFLSSVREAEQTLQQDESWSTTPKPKVDFPAPTNDFGGAQLDRTLAAVVRHRASGPADRLHARHLALAQHAGATGDRRR